MDGDALASTLAVLNQRIAALTEELRAIRQMVEEQDALDSGHKNQSDA